MTTLDISGRADVMADVTDEAALRRIAGEIGPVDVLINSAGIMGANKPCECSATGVLTGSCASTRTVASAGTRGTWKT